MAFSVQAAASEGCLALEEHVSTDIYAAEYDEGMLAVEPAPNTVRVLINAAWQSIDGLKVFNFSSPIVSLAYGPCFLALCCWLQSASDQYDWCEELGWAAEVIDDMFRSSGLNISYAQKLCSD